MALPFDSAVHNAGTAKQNLGGTIVFNNGGLMYVYTRSENGKPANTKKDSLAVAVGTTHTFVQTQNIEDLAHFSEIICASKFPSAQKLDFTTTTPPAIVACGTYNYIFWIDGKNGAHTIGCIRCKPDFSNPSFATIALIPDANQAAGAVFQNVCAMVLPNGRDIAVQGFAKIGTGPDTYFATSVFQPDSFEPFESLTLRYRLLRLTGTDLTKSATRLSAAWFTQGERRGASLPADQLLFHVVILYSNGDDSTRPESFVWSADENAYPIAGPNDNGQVTIWSVAWQEGWLGKGAQIVRDPAGSLMAVYCKAGSKQLALAKFAPNTVDKSKAGINQPQWLAERSITDNNDSACWSNWRPSACFIAPRLQRGKSPAALPGPDGTMKVYENCLLQRQVIFVMLEGGDDQCRFMTNFYGTNVCLPEYARLTPKPHSETNKLPVLVSMIADTFPYPVPDPNIWDDSSPDGMADWSPVAYEYLVSDEGESSASTEATTAIGVEAGVSTTKGFGPMLETSLAVGYTRFSEELKTVARTTAFTVVTKGTLPGMIDSAGDPTKVTFDIRKEGHLFGHTATDLVQDAYAFVARGGKFTQDGGTPVASNMRPSGAPTAIGGEFKTFCYVPGNLETYSQFYIDKTMKQAFDKLSGAAKDEFVIAGVDYRPFYGLNRYLASIEEAFGAKCFGASGDLSYLEYSFGSTGQEQAQYQDTTEFTEAGTYFADFKLYGGIGGGIGGGFAVLDLYETSAYGMAGVEIHYAHTTATSTGKSYGISIPTYLNALAKGEAYTARMYFLNPSPLWALELKHFGYRGASLPRGVDYKNSGPTRILFTVPYMSQTLADRMRRMTQAPSR